MPDAERPLVVIPTYQEAENIATVLQRLRAAAPGGVGPGRRRRQPRRHRRPGRGDRRRRWGRSRCCGGPGQGRAGQRLPRRVRARHRRRATTCWSRWTPTFSHDPADLPRLLDAVADGADLAIGSRYVPGGSTPRLAVAPAAAVDGGATATWAWSSASGSATPPPGSGPTGPTCSRRSTTLPPRADGYAFQVEMAYRVHQTDRPIVEIPITFSDRQRRHLEDVRPHRGRGDGCS